MRGKDAFADYHPIVNLIYFVLVIAYALMLVNPVCLGMGFLCTFVYSVLLKGKGAIGKNLLFMIPMILLTALLNPLFSHEGVTIITYLPSGNPLTLESILYGISAAFLLVTIINMFLCFNEVITSDKMIFLFGRCAPYISLVLSMTLKFVPEFIGRFGAVYRAQKAAGFTENGKCFKRTKTAIRIFRSTVTWAFERSVATSDSMKSRGYGLPGRRAYGMFKFRLRDGICLAFMVICAAILCVGLLKGYMHFTYYPAVTKMEFDGLIELFLCAYGALLLVPIFVRVCNI